MPPLPARLATTAALSLALAGATAASASAATLYVDRDGVGGACSDARTPAQNTIATPWCSLAQGLRAAPPGTVLAVRRGAYPRVTLTDAKRASLVTVKPAAGEVPVIAGMTLSKVAKMRFTQLRFTAGIQVLGGTEVQFVDNEVSATPKGMATESGFTTAGLTRGVFLNNLVHDVMNGITVTGLLPAPNTDLTIWGNRFRDVGNDGIGINAGSARILVARNDLDRVKVRADMNPDAHSDGMQALGPIDGLVAWGNRVHGGGRGFLLMVASTEWGTPGAGLTNVLLQNNVFSERDDFAIRTFSTPGARIINNTAWQTGNGGIDVRDRMNDVNAPSTGLVLANNITSNLLVDPAARFAYRDHNLAVKGAIAGPGDAYGTPAFENAAAGDFRLKAASPGLNAADAGHAPVLDMRGRVRVDAADLGAVERGGITTSSPFASVPPEVSAIVTSSGAVSDVTRALALGR